MPQSIQWRFRECGNHFHVEVDVGDHVLPGGTLTKGCCWPTAHKLIRTNEGYGAKPTKAENVVIGLLAGCVPARALGHALGLSAAHYQHSISGTLGARPLEGEWKRHFRTFEAAQFPVVGSVQTSNGKVCPLLVVGQRGESVFSVPLIDWPQEGAKDIPAGYEVVSVPAWAVNEDKQVALATCQARLANQSTSEALRDNLARILSIINPHEYADPDFAPIYVSALLNEYLATDRSGKFDRECREILDTLLAPDGEPYGFVITGMYLGLVRYLAMLTEPFLEASESGDFDGVAEGLELRDLVRVIVCVLVDLQAMQNGKFPLAHRATNEFDELSTNLLLPGGLDPPGTAITLKGRQLEMMAPMIRYIEKTAVRHPITNPGGAVLQAIEAWVRNDKRPNLRADGSSRRQ